MLTQPMQILGDTEASFLFRKCLKEVWLLSSFLEVNSTGKVMMLIVMLINMAIYLQSCISYQAHSRSYLTTFSN